MYSGVNFLEMLLRFLILPPLRRNFGKWVGKWVHNPSFPDAVRPLRHARAMQDIRVPCCINSGSVCSGGDGRKEFIFIVKLTLLSAMSYTTAELHFVKPPSWTSPAPGNLAFTHSLRGKSVHASCFSVSPLNACENLPEGKFYSRIIR